MLLFCTSRPSCNYVLLTLINGRTGAGGRTRTGTALSRRGILSPLRLPFRHARVVVVVASARATSVARMERSGMRDLSPGCASLHPGYAATAEQSGSLR